MKLTPPMMPDRYAFPYWREGTLDAEGERRRVAAGRVEVKARGVEEEWK